MDIPKMTATEKLFRDAQENQVNNLAELGKSPETVLSEVKDFKEWLNNKNQYPKVFSDARITRLLVTNKFNQEKARKKFKNYFYFKKSYPEFFQEPCTPKLRDCLRTWTTAFSPKLLHGKYRVILGKVNQNYDLDSFDLKNLVPFLIHVTDLALEYDMFSKVIILLDVPVSLRLLTRLNPMLIQRFVTIVVKAYSSRFEAIYIINCPSFAKHFCYFVLTFIPKKIQQRVHFLNSPDDIFEYFPKEVLPEDYGGTEAPLSVLAEDLWKAIEENIELLRIIKDAQAQDENNERKSWSFFGRFGNYK